MEFSLFELGTRRPSPPGRCYRRVWRLANRVRCPPCRFHWAVMDDLRGDEVLLGRLDRACRSRILVGRSEGYRRDVASPAATAGNRKRLTAPPPVDASPECGCVRRSKSLPAAAAPATTPARGSAGASPRRRCSRALSATVRGCSRLRTAALPAAATTPGTGRSTTRAFPFGSPTSQADSQRNFAANGDPIRFHLCYGQACALIR